MRKTDQAVMDLLKGDSPLNTAIEQARSQRQPLSPIEMRRMEFEAVEKIIAVFG